MIQTLIAIAKEAGALLKEGFFAPKTLEFKTPVDLVTQYDLAVQERAQTLLASAFPQYVIIGEEGDATTQMTPPKAIYIDPIDGTTNFVHGIPFCCISIGVWEEGRGVAGVVYNPMQEELFSAQRGHGAFLNGTPLRIGREANLLNALVATGFPYTKMEEGEDYRYVTERFARILPKTRDIRRFGAAALDLCYVAAGRFDGFYEINLQPWDVAAGIVIVEEAGGIVLGGSGARSGVQEKLVIAGNEPIARTLHALLS